MRMYGNLQHDLSVLLLTLSERREQQIYLKDQAVLCCAVDQNLFVP